MSRRLALLAPAPRLASTPARAVLQPASRPASTLARGPLAPAPRPTSAPARALLGAALAAAFLTGLLAPGWARAAYTPPQLVSFEGDTQFEGASNPAISADGRYVAFSGSFDGVSGVYRKDLLTGELELVAGSDSQDPALSAPDAGAPSISPEGRYVSFTTNARLDPADDQPGDAGDCSSVYVRDMSKAPGEPGAYILASALNGSAEGLAYTGSAEGGCPGGGSSAAGRVALALSPERGLEVVFTVLGQSDLTTGLPAQTTTAPAQIAVRYIATDTTMLVSQTLSSLGSATPEAVPGGAAFSDRATDSSTGESTAAISADGSTVAWMGVEIPEQAPASDALTIANPPESPGDTPEHFVDEYAEPLWRRIADGPAAPIRRVTGGDDPLCGCAGPLATHFNPESEPEEGVGPMYGTYIEDLSRELGALEGGTSTFYEGITPQLSETGQQVAFLSTQPDTGEEPNLPGNYFTTANVFVANMAEGLSRSQALTRITQWAGYNFGNPASTGPIDAIAISPDGTRVAFTTERIDFPLSPPALLTPALGGPSSRELYVANLPAGTLRLASYGYEGEVGEPANGPIDTPSFAGNQAHTLAFASGATNLVYGAYNGSDSNVFVTSEIASPPVAGVQTIGPAPADPLAPQPWEILASAAPGPHGTVLVYVNVPGAGRLTASARAEVPATVMVIAKAAKGNGKGKGRHREKRTILAARTVASAKASPGGAAVITLRLTSASAYRALVASHDGLYATIALSFHANGKPTLTKELEATFHGTLTKPAQPTTKPAQPTTKPAQPTKPAKPTTEPAKRPGGKQVETGAHGGKS